MKKTILLIALAATATIAAEPSKAATPPKPAVPEKPKPLTPEEEKKALYVLGVFIAQRTPVGQAGLSAEEFETVLKGFTAAALNKPLEVKPEEAMQKVQQLLTERQQARGEEEKKKGAAYLEKAAAAPGAQKLPSGLVYTELTAGTGPSPAPTDTVQVHYKGELTDGKEFDSSYKRGTPTEFRLDRVIRCWTDGVGKMKVGGKSKLVCPSELAYGERGMGGNVPPNSVLVFEVELLGIPSQDAGK